MKPSNSATQGQPNPRKIRWNVAFGPLFPTALYREQTTRNLTQPNSQQTLTITGGQINQDPPYTQKPIYYTFFADHIWSWILCSPVKIGCLRFAKLCWVGKQILCQYYHESDELPNNPRPTQPQENLGVESGICATFCPYSTYFSVGWDWFYVGNRLQESQHNHFYPQTHQWSRSAYGIQAVHSAGSSKCPAMDLYYTDLAQHPISTC